MFATTSLTQDSFGKLGKIQMFVVFAEVGPEQLIPPTYEKCVYLVSPDLMYS